MGALVVVELSDEPWKTYDAFVSGASILELSKMLNRDWASVLADIQHMRQAIRSTYPGISDEDADEMRMLDHVIARSAKYKYDASMQQVGLQAREKKSRLIEASQIRAEREEERQAIYEQ